MSYVYSYKSLPTPSNICYALHAMKSTHRGALFVQPLILCPYRKIPSNLSEAGISFDESIADTGPPLKPASVLLIHKYATHPVMPSPSASAYPREPSFFLVPISALQDPTFSSPKPSTPNHQPHTGSNKC
jgi:hypothetical protein